MERASLDLSRLLVAAGAIGLFGSLFLPWLEVGGANIEILPAVNLYSGWRAFEIADILLTLIAAGVLIGLGIAIALDARWPYLGIAALGWCAVVLTLFAVYYPAHVPAINEGSNPQIGFLGAVLAGGAIAGGGLWSGLARPED